MKSFLFEKNRYVITGSDSVRFDGTECDDDVFVPRVVQSPDGKTYKVTDMIRLYSTLSTKQFSSLKFPDDCLIEYFREARADKDDVKLDYMYFPKSIKEINETAFSGLIVKNIEIQEGSRCLKKDKNGLIYSIKFSDLVYCPHSVTNVVMSDPTERILCFAFGCSQITSINIPSSTRVICQKAFYECINLESISFNENSKLEKIGKFAFQRSDALKEVEFPASLKSIGKYAFNGCSSLVLVVFPEESNLQYIKRNAFKFAGLKSLSLPAKLMLIGSAAFQDCRSLATVEFHQNSTIKTIDEFAFENTAIKEIAFPSSLETINRRAFMGCRGLAKIVINENSLLTDIGSETFSHCTALSTKQVPSRLKKLVDSVCDSEEGYFCSVQ